MIDRYHVNDVLTALASEAGVVVDDETLNELTHHVADVLDKKPQFILTDSNFVIQEVGDDGKYRMVARVAHRREGDPNAGRLVRMLNEAHAAEVKR